MPGEKRVGRPVFPPSLIHSLRTSPASERRLKRPPTQRRLKRTQLLKCLIARVEKSGVIQYEPGQVVRLSRACRAACLAEEIQGCILHRVKKRFSVVPKSLRRRRCQFRHRRVQFIEVQPCLLKKELRPDKQNFFRDKRARKPNEKEAWPCAGCPIDGSRDDVLCQ